jgi:Na+-transporting NADH:ubiquinone oxidoreductase subunit C
MAIDKNSNRYTFFFAITTVVVVGSALAIVYSWLKPYQDANDIVKKKIEILSAIGVTSGRDSADYYYDKYIIEEECVVLDAEGRIMEGEVAFDVDIKKEYKDQTLPADKRRFPLYAAELNGEKLYILPVVGSGLWGPIWGFVAIKSDLASIYGATFGHKGETPGLGAEINQPFFYQQFQSESISSNGAYTKITVVKDGTGGEPKKVDGITGGTITSKGVEEMLDRTFQVYVKYFATKTI